ncbi:MAG: KH domain-containing protein [Verrucomicrobiae bacterium]|nr:KH domain-containing protein [Verrucomicrobiae bacterium]
MQAFIEYVVKSVVDHPEDVSITQTEKGEATVYQLKLHPDDVGKIIGKGGVMINAMRSLVQAASAKKGMRCLIEVVNEPTS